MVDSIHIAWVTCKEHEYEIKKQARFNAKQARFNAKQARCNTNTKTGFVQYKNRVCSMYILILSFYV